MTYQDIFKRYELKFLITDEQLKRMQEVMREHVESDRFGRSAICNLYYVHSKPAPQKVFSSACRSFLPSCA